MNSQHVDTLTMADHYRMLGALQALDLSDDDLEAAMNSRICDLTETLPATFLATFTRKEPHHDHKGPMLDRMTEELGM